MESAMDEMHDHEEEYMDGVRFQLDVELIPDIAFSSDSDTSVNSIESHDSGISESSETSEKPENPVFMTMFFATMCTECGVFFSELEESSMAVPCLTRQESERLVNRLRNTNVEKFHTMCKMHLSFLLDLPGSSLEDFLGNCPELTCEKSKGLFHFGKKKLPKEIKYPENGIFGVPLNQKAMDAIYPILEFLEQPENARQEGLFRKSGHIGRQKILREKLNNEDDIQIELDKGVYSAHDCASVLKTFLGELPEPLLSEKFYMAHCQVPDMVLEDKQLQTVQLLVQLLPADNCTLLQCLLSLLHTVTQQGSSKMTADTLGTLFAPHLLVPRKMTANELQLIAGNITRAVSFMIERAPEILKVPEPLVRDIAIYWEEMEEVSESRPGSAHTSEEADGTTCRHRFRKRIDPSDVLINTTVAFADRQASKKAAASTDTQMALAQLYAHVSSMPESAKKRKLLKQFNKANGGVCSPLKTPAEKYRSPGHKRSRSLGESLKKMVSRNHKRRGSGHTLQLHATSVPCNENTEQCSTMPPPVMHTPVIKSSARPATPTAPTPVMRLFKNELRQHRSILPSSPRVHIVDLKEGLSSTGKRKSPGTDSPVSRSSKCRLSELQSHCDPSEEIENNCLHAITAPPTPPREHGRLHRLKKSSSKSPVLVTPDRRFERPSSFISPITMSITKAPKNVQTNMMTPGSRVPMAMIQTP